ncbi:MAG: methyl-accepting chemotaxis protein [Pseudomonadota bacterium]
MMRRERGAGSALFFGILLCILLIAAAALHVLGNREAAGASQHAQFLTLSSEALTAALDAQEAVNGQEAAFERLKKQNSRFMNQREVQRNAASIDGLNAERVAGSWGLVVASVKKVIDGQEAVIGSLDSAALASQRVGALLSEMGNVTAALTPRQRQQFSPVLERVELQAEQLVLALEQRGLALTAKPMQDPELFLREVVSSFGGSGTVAGVPALSGAQQSQLTAVQSAMASVSQELGNTLTALEAAKETQLAAAQIDTAARALNLRLGSVRAEAGTSSWWQSSWLPLALLGGALLSALGLMIGARSRPEEPPVAVETGSDVADKQQEAILRLLDEMGDLADGDLTVEATVTEDITGAIADAINYAIEALRDLVSTIDGAAESVDSAARQTQASANHLAKASDNQSKQVASATDSIAKMAHSIEQVSSNAERSSEVTRHSVEIAHKGGEAVRRTIDGMNTIRETIQDTSKRIKRLGESSQEIGNIVELINDIAEQTNILALNASIQASMAGEAGRGFGVVADEVQRLAERSTNATKQIEVLVKTIQADTNEAVVSMERSTTDVVSGALLAENAGAALDEIEKVSNQIASLVQNISGSARQQATAASDVTRNMSVLQEISAQTAENTSATSDSISKLAEMASQLRHSVTGFTLPKEMVMEEAEAVAEEEDALLQDLVATEENDFIETIIENEKSST